MSPRRASVSSAVTASSSSATAPLPGTPARGSKRTRRGADSDIIAAGANAATPSKRQRQQSASSMATAAGDKASASPTAASLKTKAAPRDGAAAGRGKPVQKPVPPAFNPRPRQAPASSAALSRSFVGTRLPPPPVLGRSHSSFSSLSSSPTADNKRAGTTGLSHEAAIGNVAGAPFDAASFSQSSVTSGLAPPSSQSSTRSRTTSVATPPPEHAPSASQGSMPPLSQSTQDAQAQAEELLQQQQLATTGGGGASEDDTSIQEL